jgi:hypothetical protein
MKDSHATYNLGVLGAWGEATFTMQTALLD